MLSVVAGSIDEGIADVQVLYGTLSEALAKPHVLDDDTLERTERAYRETLEWIDVYERQLARWQAQRLTGAQRAEVDRLAQQLPGWRESVRKTLQLASELKAGTIDSIMRTDPTELALQVLLGVRPAPWGVT